MYWCTVATVRVVMSVLVYRVMCYGQCMLVYSVDML